MSGIGAAADVKSLPPPWAYLDLVALRSLTQTTSNALQQSLGLATGQTISTGDRAQSH